MFNLILAEILDEQETVSTSNSAMFVREFRRDFADFARVANTSESEPALFPAKKGQKPPPIFH